MDGPAAGEQRQEDHRAGDAHDDADGDLVGVAQDAAEDVAAAVFTEITRGASDSAGPPRKIELAGDQVTSQFSYLAGLAMRRHHRSARLPLPVVEAKLRLLSSFVREGRLPVPEELQMLSVSLLSERGSLDLRALGIEPTPVNPLTG